MLVTPDFSEVADAVTPGTYKVIVKKGELKDWPKGGQYVKWELETVGAENPKNNGRRIYHTTSISGRGAFTLQQMYHAAIGTALTGEFDTEQVVGKEVAVDIIDGIRNGNPTGYTEVKRVKALNM